MWVIAYWLIINFTGQWNHPWFYATIDDDDDWLVLIIASPIISIKDNSDRSVADTALNRTNLRLVIRIFACNSTAKPMKGSWTETAGIIHNLPWVLSGNLVTTGEHSQERWIKPLSRFSSIPLSVRGKPNFSRTERTRSDNVGLVIPRKGMIPSRAHLTSTNKTKIVHRPVSSRGTEPAARRTLSSGGILFGASYDVEEDETRGEAFHERLAQES